MDTSKDYSSSIKEAIFNKQAADSVKDLSESLGVKVGPVTDEVNSSITEIHNENRTKLFLLVLEQFAPFILLGIGVIVIFIIFLVVCIKKSKKKKLLQNSGNNIIQDQNIE